MIPKGVSGFPANAQQPVQVNIPIQDTKILVCACGSKVFVQTVQVRYVSPLLSPNGQPMFVQLPQNLICVHCRKTLDPQKATHEEATNPMAVEG